MSGRPLERREFLSVGALSVAGALAPDEARVEARPQVASQVKALTFDVFGTVVDWRTSLIREGQQLTRTHGIQADWEAFADGWRSGYGPAMNRVRTGELPWTKIDDLHRMILDDLLVEFSIRGLSEAEIDNLNRAWHRLIPWSDSVTGLYRLKSRYVISTLSNGNVSLLTNMAKNAGLPWDCVLSAELTGHYKTDPEVYEKAADLLSLPPTEVMMVAAHRGDLVAAKAIGFKTALVHRPLEYGPNREVDLSPDPRFDYNAMSFIELAEQMGI
ncbi:MAG: haloacid dehalogenase type II [Gemmatimonadota bacterium]|nr:haloacid dehalogenase type II [Gemmatimonadota bacterium]MDH3422178.1 haloacid dehalogenase type II [Gemmatimonadota bacterium]